MLCRFLLPISDSYDFIPIVFHFCTLGTLFEEVFLSYTLFDLFRKIFLGFKLGNTINVVSPLVHFWYFIFGSLSHNL